MGAAMLQSDGSCLGQGRAVHSYLRSVKRADFDQHVRGRQAKLEHPLDDELSWRHHHFAAWAALLCEVVAQFAYLRLAGPIDFHLVHLISFFNGSEDSPIC